MASLLPSLFAKRCPDVRVYFPNVSVPNKGIVIFGDKECTKPVYWTSGKIPANAKSIMYNCARYPLTWVK